MTLKEYIEAQTPKLSHAAFGARIGVTQAAINRYVRGVRFPSPEMIRKIQDATDGNVKVSDWYAEMEKAS
jgi:transcriptional regulator with XRE-family HTH domain